ncbi:inosose dehydratase [Leucothrix sargassi]|nr:inosose dehydratase [Leucothrix sargassi]
MNIQLSNAPCSWGIEFADAPKNPPWERVLDEIHEAGYSGTELGPLGYLPTDINELTSALAQRELSVVAGTLFKHLHKAEEYDNIIAFTRKNCEVLQQVNAKYMVMISHVCSPRTDEAGQVETATRLNDREWQQMMKTITDCADICLEYGITPTLHAHTGSYIEYEDELDRAMQDLDFDKVKLCIDTGHCLYAGMDPAAILRRYADRVAYVHFKDIKADVHAHTVENSVDFYSAISNGIFCPIGQGAVDFDDVFAALNENNFAGWITVEQDIDPESPHSPKQFAIDSRNYINSHL